MTLRILLAGEGPSELGGWAAEPQYRGVARQRRDARRLEPPFVGVLEAFLAATAPGAFEIVDAVLWKSLPFYRSGGGNRTERPMSKEELNVRALSLLAHDRACDAVVYVRDKDRSEERQRDLARGREALDQQAIKAGLRVAGGVSVQCIEAWVLAVWASRFGEPVPEARKGERPKGRTRLRGCACECNPNAWTGQCRF
jgi:hypothetical protein